MIHSTITTDQNHALFYEDGAGMSISFKNVDFNWHPLLTMRSCLALYQTCALVHHTMLHCTMLSLAKWSWHRNVSFKRMYLASPSHYALLYYTSPSCCTACVMIYFAKVERSIPFLSNWWVWHPNLTKLHYTNQEYSTVSSVHNDMLFRTTLLYDALLLRKWRWYHF